MVDEKKNPMDAGQGEIVIYQSENGDTRIDVRFVDETVWLTQQQMAELFQSSRTNIVEHIQHIYSTYTKRANWTRVQPVGNSDRFVLRVAGRFQEKFHIIIWI